MKKGLKKNLIATLCCAALGLFCLAPAVNFVHADVEIPTVETQFVDFDLKRSGDTDAPDGDYYREDLSGTEKLNDIGRYFDATNYGVWEIPFNDADYEQVVVDVSIKTVWRIHVAVANNGITDLSELTWTIGHEYTDDDNRYTVLQNPKSDVTNLLTKGDTDQSIYVKISDPSTDDGYGPQVTHMRVYVYKVPELSADSSGYALLGNSISVVDAVGLTVVGSTEDYYDYISCDIADETVLSYSDGLFTGLKAGSTEVTFTLGDNSVTSTVSVGGFIFKAKNSITSAEELGMFRDDLSGGALTNNGAYFIRYFDMSNVGIWEIELPVYQDYVKGIVTFGVSAYWNIDIYLGESGLQTLDGVSLTRVSSNAASRLGLTDVKINLADYAESGQTYGSLYVKVTDPSTDDGYGPQVHHIGRYYHYMRDPKVIGVTAAESVVAAIGETVAFEVKPVTESGAEYSLAYSVADDSIAQVYDGKITGKKEGETTVTVSIKDKSGTVVSETTLSVTVSEYAKQDSFLIHDGVELPSMDGSYSGYWREDLTTRRFADTSNLNYVNADTAKQTGVWYRYFDCNATGVWEFKFPDTDFGKLKLTVRLSVYYYIEIAVAETASFDSENYTWVSPTITEWTKIVDGYCSDSTNVVLDVSEYLPDDTAGKGLYVKIGDPTVSDGHGPKVERLGVTYIYDELPADFFDLTVSAEDISVYEGQTKEITHDVENPDGIAYTLGYSVDDSTVATVSESGRITGVKAGTATVTVSVLYTDGTVIDTCQVTVTVVAMQQDTPPAESGSGCGSRLGGNISAIALFAVLACLSGFKLFVRKER